MFRSELTPIFTRLSSDELLSTCEKGLAQNQNESVNNVLWTKCSKRVFIGKSRFTLAVCDAVTSFNDGARRKKTLMQKLNLTIGPNAE